MGRGLFDRVRGIIESARVGAERSVNTAQVVSNWLIGREIVVDEQRGKRRADYGYRILEGLALKLSAEYGEGFSRRNLNNFRAFFILYPRLLPPGRIWHTACAESSMRNRERNPIAWRDPAISTRWRPGLLHSDLSWSHYRTLLRVENPAARAFYEIEAVKSGWSVRELARQINSLLYERLAKSRDKAGLMRLAIRGQEIRRPGDVFKDPVVIEFLGLPESPRLLEPKLEEALIGGLQRFLLELGKGFAFLARQERLTLDGDHFYVDLVFYHAVLKRYVLVDLKVGKLTHQDLGQMQLYANYFDRERRTPGDGPTLGLILCTDKNDAVVRYTLGEGQDKIFASRCRLHLPTEAELEAELKREIRERGK